MNKYISLAIGALIAFSPAVSLATVGNINGNGDGNQTLVAAADMHMDIVTSGGTHTFQWNNTPWNVNQGGTGATTPFSDGGVFFFSSALNRFAQSANLAWDNTANVLTVGGTLNTTNLTISGALSGFLQTDASGVVSAV